MLAITEQAAQAIQTLTGDQPGAGLRMFSQNTDVNGIHVGLSVEAAPQPTDEVVEEMGCQVFVDSALAPAIDGRTLDVRTEGQQLHFALVS